MDMILVTSMSGMRMIDRNGKKGFLELDEPAWAPDDNFRACVGCNKMFGLFNRKHHCRRCGGVYCGDCATEKVIPMRLRFIDPVRMCGKCQKIARWENDYFNNYQMKLKTGEQLIVETETGGRDEGTVSLGGDGGLLQITSETNLVVPILMDEVTSFRVTEEGSDGVHMLSIDSFGGRSVILAKTNRPESVVFLNGLRKALRMSAKPDHQKSGPSNNDAT